MRHAGWATMVTALLAVALAAAGCAKPDQSTTEKPDGPVKECSYKTGGSPARPVDPPGKWASSQGTVVVTMEMAAGPVTMTLDRGNAPCAVHSMEALVSQGFYDGTTCHRLVDQAIFILQCGDPTATGTGGPGYSYADELSGKEVYKRGTVAMANSGPDTNGSQFFLVWADTALEPNYTILGTIDEQSMVAIGKIASQGVDPGGTSPIADASITKVVLG